MSGIELKRGDTLNWVGYRKDENGDAVDLTGATLACTVRHALTGTEYDLTAAVTTALSGIFRLSATAAATALWKLGLYEADLQITWADTSISTSSTWVFNVTEKISDGD